MTQKLRPRRFVVVGAGGIGSWLAEGLARLAQFRAPGSALVIVDGDNYEPKNAERQAFVGAGNKAAVKAEQLDRQFPDVFVVGDERWVVEAITDERPVEDEEGGRYIAARDLLAENDVVYAVVDNFAARKVLFDAARDFDNIDVFTGGNDDGLFGSVYHYARRDGHDVTDHPVEWHAEYDNPPDRNPAELSCSERAQLEGGTQLLATNMAVAAVLLGRTHKVIVCEKPDTEAEIFFDLGVGLAQGYDRSPEPVPAMASSDSKE